MGIVLTLWGNLPGNSAAQDAEPAPQNAIIKVWGADDGLTEGSVTDIAQTPEGYLWIGTLFGSVLRFDGTHFVSYNSANTPEFSLKWGVPRLMVDREGTLWIIMYDGGMTTWDAHGFRSVFTNTNQPDHMLWSAHGRVIFAYGDGQLLSGRKAGEQWNWETVALEGASAQDQACADKEGKVWYLRGDQEIRVWDGKETRVMSMESAGLAGQRIKVLMADGNGQIWVGTDNAIARWKTNHFEPQTPTNGEPVLNVKRMVSSGAGSLWVEANGRMRRCVGQRWLAESEGWNSEIGRRTSLRFLHGDAEGGLWSGVGDLGLIHVQPDGTFRRLTTRDGLPSNAVHFAFQDRDGDTWTGYERGELVQVRRRMFRSISKDDGLNDSLINTVCEDAKGAIWIGTHSGVVGRYADGTCTNINLPAAARAQDSCVAADSRGRVWIGAQRMGLMSWQDGQLRQVASQNQLQGYPRLLVPARDGKLWVGTLFSIISVTNDQLSFQYSAQDVGGHPTGLAEAADGTIWAGTLAGVLLHWDGQKFVSIEPPDRNSLGRIWAIWPTADGGLWAGTEAGGLLHWKNGAFHRYTTKNGLPSDSIVQVLGDQQGNLWLGTRAGIARIPEAALARFERGELDDLPVSVYGQSDGLMTIGSAIIFQPNCWRGRDGTLFFAMANSVAEVNPGEVRINHSPPEVVLEQLLSDEAPVWPPRVGGIVTSTGTAAEEPSDGDGNAVHVGPGRGDLEFRYTGLSLGSPLRVRFKHKLEGLENFWHDAGPTRSAVYRHVPPGDYVFRVMACNSDGVWSRGGTLLGVKVTPHYYQTLWFQGGVGLLAVAGMSLAAAVSVRRRMRRRLELVERQHELEQERSRIAQDLHDDLGAGLTEIGLLGGLLQDPSRFSTSKQEALNRIVHRCNDLVRALDEIVWAVNPGNDSVNSLGGYLSRYAQGFLEPTSIRCRLEVQEAEPDHPLNSEQRHNLFLAFEEALTNVVRHSGAKEVRIRFSFDASRTLQICVEDDGRGLPEATDEGGDGLNNLRQRMARIGARCEIANRPSGGVSVTLSLDLANRPAGSQHGTR